MFEKWLERSLPLISKQSGSRLKEKEGFVRKILKGRKKYHYSQRKGRGEEEILLKMAKVTVKDETKLETH